MKGKPPLMQPHPVPGIDKDFGVTMVTTLHPELCCSFSLLLLWCHVLMILCSHFSQKGLHLYKNNNIIHIT